MSLQERIEKFIRDIDEDFAHYDLETFLNERPVALTPKEQKQGKKLLEELKQNE